MKREKQTSSKTNNALYGSLATRVLIISFIFIIIPLIFYSFIIYARDYEQRLNEIFEELHVAKDDQVNHISELEVLNLNFLFAVNGMINLVYEKYGELNKERIGPILQQFAAKEDITAIFFLEVKPNKDLICGYSTLPLYNGVNFTPYFSFQYLRTVHDNIFIARDPVFQHSLFFTLDIKDKNDNVVGILASSISLDSLIDRLGRLRTLYKSNISIMEENHKVIASSDPLYIGTRFERVEKGKEHSESLGKDEMGEVVFLREQEGVPPRLRYKLLNVERLAVMGIFPQTEQYLIISIPAKVLLVEIYRYLRHLVIFLACILIVGGTAAYLLTIRMAQPLRQLRTVMQKVGEGDLDQTFTNDTMGFELNYLGNRFNEMVISLQDYIEEVKKERAFKEAYAKELEIGHDIQRSLLPHKEIHISGLKIGVFFSPAKEVAGDYYDWLEVDGKALLVVADGVGKGISGCLYAYDLRSILRSFATLEPDLKQIVMGTNKLFCSDTKETGNFVTAFIALYDPQTKKLLCVNCGHNFPYIKRKSGALEKIRLRGTAFGIDEFQNVELGEYEIEEGDLVIFFTDGITDAQNELGELFTEARLEHLIQISLATSPDELIQEVKSALTDFTQGVNQYDDITLLIIERLPKQLIK